MTQAVLEIDPVNGVCRRRFKSGVVKIVTTANRYGYLVVGVGTKTKMVHRIIWEYTNGPIPNGLQIDHVNGIRTDNRICNLRLATNGQNQQNKHKAQPNNAIGVKGVCLHKQTSKYRAMIGLKGEQYCLGYFDSVDGAAAAYRGAAAILHTHNPHAEKETPPKRGNRESRPGEETTAMDRRSV